MRFLSFYTLENKTWTKKNNSKNFINNHKINKHKNSNLFRNVVSSPSTTHFTQHFIMTSQYLTRDVSSMNDVTCWSVTREVSSCVCMATVDMHFVLGSRILQNLPKVVVFVLWFFWLKFWKTLQIRRISKDYIRVF